MHRGAQAGTSRMAFGANLNAEIALRACLPLRLIEMAQVRGRLVFASRHQ
jgi:hypothetical protein